MSGPIKEVHVWPKQSSGSCIEIPKPPFPVKTPIFYFRLWLLALNGKTPVAISQIYHVFPHYKFQNQPNLSLLYATFSVSALEPSTAGENLGHLLFPVNGYPQTRFIYFSLISFCDFLYSVNLALEFQVHKLLEEIVNGGATDPFACFALGDWTSSQHSVSYCAGMGFASGWFSGKLKGKVKFPV